METAPGKNDARRTDPRRPDRRFAGSTQVTDGAKVPGFGGSAPIVLPERAKPRPAPTPTRSELEELGRRTASVAHDFNNLLSVIMVCAGEIVHGPDDGSHRERAEEIRDAAERGAELSRELLAGSGRIERPEDAPGPRSPPTTAITRSAEAARASRSDPDVRLSLVSDGHLPRVRLAPGEIERILLNLAANSRDAMPRGGSVAIRTGVVSIPPGDPTLGTGWHVRIAFADDGIGMEPEVAQRALEPYFSTKEQGERHAGSGSRASRRWSARRAVTCGSTRAPAAARRSRSTCRRSTAAGTRSRYRAPAAGPPASTPNRRGAHGRTRAASARPRRRALRR